MQKLADFGDKETAVKRGMELISQGYVVVITVVEGYFPGTFRYLIWGTKNPTALVGGWNRS